MTTPTTNQNQALVELRDALSRTLQFIDECGSWHTRQETAEMVKEARRTLLFLIRNFIPSGYEPPEALPNEPARDWQVGWYQGLLLLTNAPIEVEVLEDGLTQQEAERKARIEYPMLFRGAVGMQFIARQRPPVVPETPEPESDGDA